MFSRAFNVYPDSVFVYIFQQFEKLKFPYLTVELENRDDCSQIQAVLGELTGATSVSIGNNFMQTKKCQFPFYVYFRLSLSIGYLESQ